MNPNMTDRERAGAAFWRALAASIDPATNTCNVGMALDAALDTMTPAPPTVDSSLRVLLVQAEVYLSLLRYRQTRINWAVADADGLAGIDHWRTRARHALYGDSPPPPPAARETVVRQKDVAMSRLDVARPPFGASPPRPHRRRGLLGLLDVLTGARRRQRTRALRLAWLAMGYVDQEIRLVQDVARNRPDDVAELVVLWKVDHLRDALDWVRVALDIPECGR